MRWTTVNSVGVGFMRTTRGLSHRASGAPFEPRSPSTWWSSQSIAPTDGARFRSISRSSLPAACWAIPRTTTSVLFLSEDRCTSTGKISTPRLESTCPRASRHSPSGSWMTTLFRRSSRPSTGTGRIDRYISSNGGNQSVDCARRWF